jgi:hypothetical protein
MTLIFHEIFSGNYANESFKYLLVPYLPTTEPYHLFGLFKLKSLTAVWSSPRRVDLCGLYITQLLDCVLDLTLVGLQINDEHECVVLLNLLHCALRVKGANKQPHGKNTASCADEHTHLTMVRNWSMRGA